MIERFDLLCLPLDTRRTHLRSTFISSRPAMHRTDSYSTQIILYSSTEDIDVFYLQSAQDCADLSAGKPQAYHETRRRRLQPITSRLPLITRQTNTHLESFYSHRFFDLDIHKLRVRSPTTLRTKKSRHWIRIGFLPPRVCIIRKTCTLAPDPRGSLSCHIKCAIH